MNRRQTLLGLLTGGLIASTKNTEAAAVAIEKNRIVGPAASTPGGSIQLYGLPPGVVEIEPAIQMNDGTIVSVDEAVEIPVTSNGTAILRYRTVPLLHGLWQVYKPGRRVVDHTAIKNFELFLDYQSTNGIGTAWMYRNPGDYRGTQLRGAKGSFVMTLDVEGRVGQSVPPITVQLVDLDIKPATANDLITLPTLPPVLDVLNEWRVPRGVKEMRVTPFLVTWNSRALALRIVPEIRGVYVRLHADNGPLEIGWGRSPGDPVGAGR